MGWVSFPGCKSFFLPSPANTAATVAAYGYDEKSEYNYMNPHSKLHHSDV